MPDLKHVQRGQPLRIPALAYNAFVDATRAHQQHQTELATAGRPRARHSELVLVRNDTVTDVDRFAVLGINGVVFDPSTALETFQQRMALAGVTPADPTHRGRFVITVEPIKTDKVGLALIGGVAVVQVDASDTEIDYRHADIVDGENYLQASSDGSATILWRASGTGLKWAVVRFGEDHVPQVYEVVGELSTDEVTIQPIDSAGDPVGTSFQVQVLP